MALTKKQKELLIVAGANGSGKTTFAKEFINRNKCEFLNADEVAKSLSSDDISKKRISAGKRVIKQVEEFIAQGKSCVVLETTMSGRSYLINQINKFRAAGYSISLIFVFCDSPELCIERIEARVKEGGHDVPDEDVRRRYFRGKDNFYNLYRKMVDYLYIFYNGNNCEFKRVAYGRPKLIAVEDETLAKKFFEGIQINE